MSHTTAIAMCLWLAAQPLCAGPPAAESAQAPRPRYTPALERQWEIAFDDEITADEYARQIDYFQIEIAVISKDGKIESVSEVTKNKPTKHQSRKDREYRPAIGWRTGVLYAADRRLLRKAGIASQDKELVHYLPDDLVERMKKMETEYGGLDFNDIRRTRFRVQARKSLPGYEIVVVEQEPPRSGEPASSVSKTIRKADEE